MQLVVANDADGLLTRRRLLSVDVAHVGIVVCGGQRGDRQKLLQNDEKEYEQRNVDADLLNPAMALASHAPPRRKRRLTVAPTIRCAANYPDSSDADRMETDDEQTPDAS